MEVSPMDYRIDFFPFERVDPLFVEFQTMWESMKEPLSFLSETLLSTSNTHGYPPVNYYAEEDGSLHFEFAVAGYKQDDIDLKFEDDHLIMKILKKEEGSKTRKYFVKRIKFSEAETKAYVPFSKYDVNKVQASFNDGILSVSIPVREDAKPVKIKIN
jgi:HSP20 family molecular chaperone IbpA